MKADRLIREIIFGKAACDVTVLFLHAIPVLGLTCVSANTERVFPVHNHQHKHDLHYNHTQALDTLLIERSLFRTSVMALLV